MATPKKGQGISFRIPGGDSLPPPAPAGGPMAEGPAPVARQALPKTGIGLLSRVIANAQEDSDEVRRLHAEVDRLKLQVGEQLIDPRLIRLTRWADRHPDSFTNAAFLELKQEIESAGGNVQPVKLRPIRGAPADGSAPRFELIFGSRRTRACLELGLPVRAVVEEDVSDQALYVQMQRENRGRANLSAWEQGVSYHRALREGLFPSARKLAEVIGLDHSNVSKALRVADLPEEVVAAFASPCDIQFRWAVALDKAHQAAPDALRAAARQLARQSPRPAPGEVFRMLMDAATARPAAVAVAVAGAVDLKVALAGGRSVTVRLGKGGTATVELPRGSLSRPQLDAFCAGLKRLLDDLAGGAAG